VLPDTARSPEFSIPVETISSPFLLRTIVPLNNPRKTVVCRGAHCASVEAVTVIYGHAMRAPTNFVHCITIYFNPPKVNYSP